MDWQETLSSLNVDRTVGETEWAKPGTEAGLAMLESFIDVRLKLFESRRNDPNVAALSQLSPWIRFGGSNVGASSRLCWLTGACPQAKASSSPP